MRKMKKCEKKIAILIIPKFAIMQEMRKMINAKKCEKNDKWDKSEKFLAFIRQKMWEISCFSHFYCISCIYRTINARNFSLFSHFLWFLHLSFYARNILEMWYVRNEKCDKFGEQYEKSYLSWLIPVQEKWRSSFHAKQ